MNNRALQASVVRLYDGAEKSEELTRLLADEYTVLIDTYDEQLRELAQIRDPASVGTAPRAISAEAAGETYAYFPRKRMLVRTLGKETYRELRTNRNRELLTRDEQERFADFPIAFAGLNVGNPGAVCIALEGGSVRMKLADFDPLSLSNLNRFRAGITELGMNKALLTAEQILEADPFYELDLYPSGISPENLDAFLTDAPVKLLVEETDALPLKIRMREAAKAHRIPVIMVTGNGEGVLLDVERYDLEPETELLNGLLRPEVRAAIESAGALVPSQKVELARDFMGTKYLDERLVDSFAQFGKSLVGIPQLAEASFLRGAALCHAAKAMVLERPLPSGRYAFTFAKQLERIG